MAQKNKNSFLSSIGSSSSLSTLRKKLRGNEENCPVRTLSQLMDPSIAIPKTNVSLRSLRCKPPSSQNKQTTNDRTLDANKVVVAARIETPPLSNSNQRNRNENISYVSGRNAASSVEPSQERNVESVVRDNFPVNDHAFAIPAMRAPKTVKTLNQRLAEIDTAATLCSNLLDEGVFKQLCMVITAYCLNKASEADENHIQSDEEIAIGKILDAFIKNVGENGVYEVRLNSRANDVDNLSSISGQPPYIPAGANQFTSDQASVVNGNFGYGFQCNSSVLGFNSRLPGSTATYNRKGPSSVLGFGGVNLDSSIMSSKLPSWLIPKFMKPENVQINCSMMGGMCNPYSDVFQNQGCYPSMMGHGASSMIGYPNQSMMGGRVMGHHNQSIMSHYPQSVIGYPNQTMMGGNGMPLHSMAAMNQMRRGINNTMMNMSGLSSRHLHQNISMMQPSVQIERLNMRETNNQDDNDSEFQAESDRMPAPPPRMLPPQPKYFNSTMAEKSRNLQRSGLSSRHLHQNISIMQPSVQIERFNLREPVNNQDYNDSEFQDGSDRMPAPPPRMLPSQPKYFNSTMAVQSRNPLRTINENIPIRSEPRIVVNDNNSLINKRKRENTFVDKTNRAKAADTPARNTRNRMPPHTPATENEMNTSRVTRSGRRVKTPQHYWASDVSAVPVMAVEQRGTKRKRYSNV